MGIAIQSGVVLQKCENHWCRINTTQVVNSSLTNSTTSSVVSLVETYQYNNCSSWITQAKGLTKTANSCAVAGNGLMYDNCQGGTPNLTSATSYCSSKGMRLPTTNEARAWSSSGVPSCSNQTTWTSSVMLDSNWVWRELNTGLSKNYNSIYVRCVK